MLLTAIWSCETVVNVDVPDNSGIVTVNGIIADGIAPYVKISESTNVLSSEYFPAIENADVRLLENDIQVGIMEHSFDGVYELPFAASFSPEPGASYSLEIDVPGKDPVTAQATMPVPVSLNSFTIGDTVSIEGFPHYEITAKFDDPADVLNYYSVTISFESAYFGGYSICFRNLDTEFETPGDVFEGIEGLPFYCGNVKVRDGLFDGTEKSITFLVPQYYDYYGSDGIFTCSLQSMTEDLFLYELTAESQQWNEGNPFAQPTTVRTNIEGGVGIWGAISQSALSVSL